MKIDQSWYTRVNGVVQRYSAGGIIVRVEHDEVMVSLARQHGRTSYILPKGTVEDGESMIDTALREIEEEAGFTELELLDDLGTRARYNFKKTRWVITHYFLFGTHQLRVTPGDSRRHDKPHWHPIDRLPDIFWPDQRELIERNRDRIVRHALCMPALAGQATHR